MMFTHAMLFVLVLGAMAMALAIAVQCGRAARLCGGEKRVR
jgi:hypothetical protein